MTDIDWDVAPTDATGSGLIGKSRFPVWFGEDWYEYKTGNARHPFAIHINNHSYVFSEMTECVSRTKPEWSGEGLPQIGTVCEYQRNDVNYRQTWVAVVPMYIGQSISVLHHVASGNEFTEMTASCLFRPIRTQEQLAAEEREKAVAEMLDGYPYPGSDIARAVCEYLHDTGYQKRVQGEE